MELLTIENLLTLVMLILLQAVLGFDNLLYISLESQEWKTETGFIASFGIGLAVIFTIDSFVRVDKLVHFKIHLASQLARSD